MHLYVISSTPFGSIILCLMCINYISVDAPNQVFNFSATRTVLSPSVQSITLTWDMPFDNFDPIVSYKLENCKREATVLPPQCSAIGSVMLSSNVTQHTTNVSTNALYQFEITALNSIGESVGSFVTVLEYMVKS